MFSLNGEIIVTLAVQFLGILSLECKETKEKWFFLDNLNIFINLATTFSVYLKLYKR